MICRVVSAAEVAAPFRAEIKATISTRNSTPLLVGFLANSDPAARMYANWTSKTCKESGINFVLRECPRTELEDYILDANEDIEVHGIIVYYPVFGGTQDQYLQNIISPRKDVEGLCHTYRYNMYHNIRFLNPPTNSQKCIIPCTPLAIVKLLEFIGVYNSILAFGNRLHGKVITVINRSEVVGRPLAALLANDGAKVFSVDEFGALEFHRGEGLRLRKHEVFETTLTLNDCLALSDVVIGGVPSKNYKIPTSLLKEGVVVINFSTFKNFEDDIKEKASIYVPSVGKVTVAMLERNVLRLAEFAEEDAKIKATAAAVAE